MEAVPELLAAVATSDRAQRAPGGVGLHPGDPLEQRPVIAAPVVAGPDSDGVLVVWGAAEVGPPDSLAVLQSLAEQVGLALELATARADQDRLLIAEDRERIARDLHDVVIQRLFASGMTLQATLPLLGDDRAAERVSGVVDDLDRIISEIRTAIFALHQPGDAALRADLLRVAEEAAAQLGFTPRVRFEGPVESTIPLEIAAHLIAVAREALSNVARHARARHVDVLLSAVGGEALLSVADDGVGMSGATRRSGLANLRGRAEALGGELAIDSPEGGGTRVEWRVPLRR
jgi:signal transduction histidine kinase